MRIEEKGGSLVFLHEGKPYIRGGDFHARQQLGERPKQLNYSRAFGGKDLKPFGLSVEPTISHFKLTPEDRLLVVGSDGLWDVFNHKAAVGIIYRAIEEGLDPSTELVRRAIQEMPMRNVRDNITAIVYEIKPPTSSSEEDQEEEEEEEETKKEEEEIEGAEQQDNLGFESKN